jgi:hypothetical protein
MKTYPGKKLLMICCTILLLFTWATVSRGDTELSSFVYTGFLHYPDQIGGLVNYTYDCFTSGSTLSLTTDYIGLEADLMAGLGWDGRNTEYNSTLPILWTGALLFYPFSQTPIAPYVKAGYGGIYTWLELADVNRSGFYVFSCFHAGAGISFHGESDGNYVFIEYLRTYVNGDGEIADFRLNIYKAGYVMVF